jgi:hypothetical protein
VAFLIIMSRDGPPMPMAKPVEANTTIVIIGPSTPLPHTASSRAQRVDFGRS